MMIDEGSMKASGLIVSSLGMDSLTRWLCASDQRPMGLLLLPHRQIDVADVATWVPSSDQFAHRQVSFPSFQVSTVHGFFFFSINILTQFYVL